MSRTNLVIQVHLKAEQKSAESQLPEQFANIAVMELKLISLLSVGNTSFLIDRLILCSGDRTAPSHSTYLSALCSDLDGIADRMGYVKHQSLRLLRKGQLLSS